MSKLLSTLQYSGIWGFPIPIHYGPGCISRLPGIAQELNMTRPLVVSDSGTADLPFIGDILRDLDTAGMSPQLFSQFSPNPTDLEAIQGGEAFRNAACDGVIAVGGGSSLDAGKAIALTAGGAHEDFWMFDGFAEPLKFDIEPPFPLPRGSA